MYDVVAFVDTTEAVNGFNCRKSLPQFTDAILLPMLISLFKERAEKKNSLFEMSSHSSILFMANCFADTSAALVVTMI